MSEKIRYTCPYCGNILSDYSKKGIPFLHTKIGVPFFTCDSCGNKISTKMKYYDTLSRFKKILEITKTTINIGIKSLVFGGIFIGTPLLFYFEDGRPFGTETATQRLLNIGLWLLVGSSIIGFFQIRRYRKYFKWVRKMSEDEIEVIPIDLFKEKYPDW